MPDKTHELPGTPVATPTAIEEATEAGLEFGRAILAAEVEIVASVLGLGAALVPHPRAGSPVQAVATQSEVEDGFDNMPV